MNWKYEAIISWSLKDEAFLVAIPELPGCMTDGPTCQRAVSNAEVIIGEWITTAHELGRLVPAPKGKLMFA